MTELEKFCSQCLARKPLSEFHSYFDKKRKKTRQRAACRACMNQRSAIWRARNPSYHAEYNARRLTENVSTSGIVPACPQSID